jgi:hypothetical protein
MVVFENSYKYLLSPLPLRTPCFFPLHHQDCRDTFLEKYIYTHIHTYTQLPFPSSRRIPNGKTCTRTRRRRLHHPTRTRWRSPQRSEGRAWGRSLLRAISGWEGWGGRWKKEGACPSQWFRLWCWRDLFRWLRTVQYGRTIASNRMYAFIDLSIASVLALTPTLIPVSTSPISPLSYSLSLHRVKTSITTPPHTHARTLTQLSL